MKMGPNCKRPEVPKADPVDFMSYAKEAADKYIDDVFWKLKEKLRGIRK